MRPHCILASLALLAAIAGPATSQEDRPADQVPTQRWRMGMIVTAGNSPCGGIVGTMTVPAEWPEQEIRVVKEDITPGTRVRYQMVQDAARQMTVAIPRLGSGQEAKAILTFELKVAWEPPVADTGSYVFADPQKLDRKLRLCLRPSPYIESDDPQIVALAERVGAKEADAWSRVKAIYDWVQTNVKYKFDGKSSGALAALHSGTGDCDERDSLFIAICRAGGIPARTVRIPPRSKGDGVPGHVFAEFYLVDKQGEGHWFPCEAPGDWAFRRVAAASPILQRGDNLRIRNPQTRRMEECRFPPETLVVRSFRPGGEPKLQLVCEPVLDETDNAP